ncbi:MAG: hypothetical protein AB1640_21135 [bacterium]
MHSITPLRFRAQYLDQMFCFLQVLSDSQNHCVMRLGGRIDGQRLARAVRLLIDAEPIAGSRYVERWWKAYWERPGEIEPGSLLRVVETADGEAALRSFLLEKPDLARGPLVTVRVFRGPKDTVCLKMHHTLGDGGGLSELCRLMAAFYRKLLDDPSFEPEPNREGDRSTRQVYRSLDVRDRMRLWGGGRDAHPGRAFKIWSFPLCAGPGTPLIVQRTVEPESFEAIREYGKARGAGVNDVILTAYHRALHAVVRPEPELRLRIALPFDWRRFLPEGRAGAVCNLLGVIHSDIGHDLGNDFDATLSRVHQDMEARKRDLSGLRGLPLQESLCRVLPYRVVKRRITSNFHRLARDGNTRGNRIATPGLSNAGALDPLALEFGDVEVENAFFPGPVHYPPCFTLVLTSFRGRMTFTVRSLDSGANRSRIEHFFELFEKELSQCQ